MCEGSCRGHKGESYILELELQVVVAGKENLGPLEEQQTLDCCAVYSGWRSIKLLVLLGQGNNYSFL